MIFKQFQCRIDTGTVFYIFYKMRKYLVFIIILTIKISFAQNQANYWYFGTHCGLNFTAGMPVVLLDGQTNTNVGCATISDSIGNLLLYTAGHYLYNRNHLVMFNGMDLIPPGIFGRAIVKIPGQNDSYYVFTARHPQMYLGLYYSKIDMALDGGLGAVIEKDVPVESGLDAADRIALIKKDNSEDIWVITRKYSEDAMASYLIDGIGFHPDPVLSYLPDRNPNIASFGFLKVSYNKKYIVSSYADRDDIEICGINATTGEVNYMYTLDKPGGVDLTLSGIEFSPDSKFLYVSGYFSSDSNAIYQFDLGFISNQSDFNNSATLIGVGQATALQLARDGKIYCISEISGTRMSIINNPWIAGVGCDFQNNIIEMNPGDAGYSLPNILLDYLLRFEWTGEPCQGYPIKFKPNFIPAPDSIIWNFDELAPGSTSTELSPTYAFKYSGVHEVKVDVWYPSGRYEHTSREIEISPSPLPLLGPDTLICDGASINLKANCQADFFNWSTGQFGVSTITVSDSGTYWVKARFNDSGCEGYDTIHIGFHQPTIIDETNLQIIPTTCNGASGSITGLTAPGPAPCAYQWLDLSGNDYGTNIDATGLPAGQYQLTITDGNGCETISEVYTIEDAGNLQVLDVELTRPHCGRPDGQIIVHGFNPSGSSLQYSIDDGTTYQADSVFSGLVGTGYVVRVTDGNGCLGFYIDNPVKLADIPGPQVLQVNITNETDFLGNGVLEIIANGSTPIIYYSIDDGNTYQSNNGTFNNLGSGIYNLQVKDENGCDTSFSVEIQNIILTYLQAISSPGEHCQGEAITVPVIVENFNAVASFNIKLSYNSDNLQCEGYTGVHPQLQDNFTAWVDQLNGEITMQWQSTAAITLNPFATVVELVFTTSLPGSGDIAWFSDIEESYFMNINGFVVPAEFHAGEVTIYEPPEIILAESKTVCEGQSLSLMSIATGNQPPLTFRWIYPTGDTTNSDPFIFSFTQANAGNYTLLATDIMGCTDAQTIRVDISNIPVAAFHVLDTITAPDGYLLSAGSGFSSYLWNTGDTTESIVVNTEGMYFVKMESTAGCVGTDSIYIRFLSNEIPSSGIFIPNAFTPDNDGLNDTFTAIATCDYIAEFKMLVFDRWGGEIFESDDIFKGWDGTKNGNPCPGDAYVYKIIFSSYSVYGEQPRQVRHGAVMLVR
jgi:gliding motility-associated-like protein